MEEPATATAAEIYKIITKVEPILKKFPKNHVYIAAIAMAFGILKPEMSSEELRVCVKDCSQWMVDYLTDTNEDLTDIHFIPE